MGFAFNKFYFTYFLPAFVDPACSKVRFCKVYQMKYNNQLVHFTLRHGQIKFNLNFIHYEKCTVIHDLKRFVLNLK